MDDIYDEIEGDLRAERARNLARRYGGVAALAVLLAAAAVGGWQAWRWWEHRQDEAAGSVFLTAMQDADGAASSLSPEVNPARAQAVAAFTRVAAEGPEGYRTLARLREAALKADGGDQAAAEALYNDVANDTGADPLLRDLARLTRAERALDSGDPAQLRADLAPLIASGNPWHALAQEADALLALRQGDDARARAALKTLAQDVTAPPGVRSRANSLLARLGG